ncbi:putative membrane protein [Natranaerovirga hydrolytica]|uniref:Putative membrane protein n=1 Tax=Natranaerovirga hydrolytica TaxID=680378 RepID=A0A4R1MDN6_9FIRM|nr:ECF transporter S component [Natranaerovirga hydrolytica]TCK90576.1 putative membrane protein [Natranaerovirga hydrolytica]
MQTKKVVLVAMFIAITAVFGFTPIGFIQIPPISITLLHIPTIITAIVLGPVAGIIVSLSMGIISMLRALGSAGFDVFFIDPRVSIIPRLLIPITTYFAYVGIQKVIRSNKIAISISALIGTLTNTIFVLGMIYILYAQRIIDINGENILVRNIIFGAISVNIIIEMVAAAIIATPLVLVLKNIEQ